MSALLDFISEHDNWEELLALKCVKVKRKDNLAIFNYELNMGIDLGINIVKFFPANVYGGLKAMKALSGPFPQIKFIPTGGVDRSNIDEFLAWDKIHAVGGSFFVKEALEKLGE